MGWLFAFWCLGAACHALAALEDEYKDVALEYLTQYHYINSPADNIEHLAHQAAALDPDLTGQDAVLASGLLILQRKYGLNETGTLTNETVEFMLQPRCGNPDINHIEDIPGDLEDLTGVRGTSRSKRFAAGGYRVRPGVKVVTYKFDNFPSTGLEDQQLVRETFRRAASVWEEQSALPFKFMEVNSSTPADIGVLFYHSSIGSTRRTDGPGGTLAHAGAMGARQVSYVHFDDAEYWYFDVPSSLDVLQHHLISKRKIYFYHTAVHEIGHVLGLEHSDSPDAIMYAMMDHKEIAQSIEFTLSDDDKGGILHIYGRADFEISSVNDIDEDVYISETVPAICLNDQPIKAVLYQAYLDPKDYPGTFTGPIIYNMSTTSGFISSLVFSGDEYYRIEQQHLVPGYPRQIKQDWPGLPLNFDYVISYLLYAGYPEPEYLKRIFGPALVYRNSSNYAVNEFFVGDQVYIFGNNLATSGMPLNASQRYPGWRTNFSAAFFWPGNQELYMIEGNEYYKYNSDLERIEEGYPRPLSNWVGLPDNIDAVFSGFDMKTYFVDGDDVYEFFTNSFSVISKSSFRETWLGCDKYNLTRNGPGTTASRESADNLTRDGYGTTASTTSADDENTTNTTTPEVSAEERGDLGEVADGSGPTSTDETTPSAATEPFPTLLTTIFLSVTSQCLIYACNFFFTTLA